MLEIGSQMSINEPYDSNLEPRSSELESISLDISSQEDLFIGNVPRKMRRHSEAAMMDFSFLEEETGDMYSQIKSRKNRRDRGLSLDCGDLYPFPDETPLKWLQEQNTPDALSSERVTDKESESSTKNTARANSPRTVLHDHDYVTENALNEEESSSQSLIRSSRRSEGKRTTTDNHGNLLTIFPSVPYGHAQGKSQVSEFSLPLNDYGDLMVDKVDSPQHLSDDLVESAKMIKIISTIKPHEVDKTDLTQDLGDVIGDQSTPGCPLVITEDRDQQLMNIRSDTLPSNDACEQEMQSDAIPISCPQTLNLNVPSPETTAIIELNTKQHTPEMYRFVHYVVSMHTGRSKKLATNTVILSPAAPKARDGRYCNAPHPSVCLSVRLSVTFSFRTVTQKRIDVFPRNFAGMCTMSWGCAVYFFILMECCLNFL